MIAEEKNCDNCAKYDISFMTCDICHRVNDFRHWQPKEPEKNCDTCEHEYDACLNCKWESQKVKDRQCC